MISQSEVPILRAHYVSGMEKHQGCPMVQVNLRLIEYCQEIRGSPVFWTLELITLRVSWGSSPKHGVSGSPRIPPQVWNGLADYGHLGPPMEPRAPWSTFGESAYNAQH